MVKILIETLKKYRHNFTDIHKLITQRKEIIEYNWSLLRRIKVIRLIEQLCSFFSPVGKKTELSVRPNTYVRFETNPLLVEWLEFSLFLFFFLCSLFLSLFLCTSLVLPPFLRTLLYQRLSNPRDFGASEYPWLLGYRRRRSKGLPIGWKSGTKNRKQRV